MKTSEQARASGELVGSIIRYGSQVIMLWIAWPHCHWSIWLILFLLTVNVELSAIVRSRQAGEVERLADLVALFRFTERQAK